MVERINVPDGRTHPKKMTAMMVRSLKLLREPVTSDYNIFTATKTGDIHHVEDAEDLEEAAKDDDADLEAAAAIGPETVADNHCAIVTPGPQWTPKLHYSTLIHHLIDAQGPAGITSTQLADIAMGSPWKRSSDEALAKLSDKWQLSQPSHLRHLSIVRDTKMCAQVTQFVYRTFTQFNEAVRLGQASWEYQLHEPSDQKAAQQVPELDKWGFPRLETSLFGDAKGALPIAKCVNWQNKFKVPATRKHELPGASPRAIKRRRLNGNLWPAQRKRDVSAEIATPIRDTESKHGGDNEPIKFVIDGFAEKRVARETKEWKARCRRRAEALIRADKLIKRPSESISLADNSAVASDGVASNLPKVEAQDEKAQVPPRSVIPAKRKRAVPFASRINVPISEEELQRTQEALEQRQEPGVAINPPGSIVLKMINDPKKGRPRNAIIAVFKLDSLRDLKWFETDLVTYQQHERNISTKKRQKLQHSESAATEKEGGMMDPGPSAAPSIQMKAGVTTSNAFQPESIVHDASNHFDAQHNPRQELQGEHRLPETYVTGVSAQEQVREDLGRPSVTIADQQDNNKHPAQTKIEVQSMPQGPPVASSASQPKPNITDTSGPLSGLSQFHASYKGSSNSASPRTGIRVAGGMAQMRRGQVITSIVHRCGGLFPGNNEIGAPFAYEYARLYHARVDRATIIRTVNNLVSSQMLKRMSFAFVSKAGLSIERHILTLPNVDPEGEAVQILRDHIIEAHPVPYVPDMTPGIKTKTKVTASGRVVNTDLSSKTGRHLPKHPPKESDTVVNRLYANTWDDYRPGMGEPRLQAEIDKRRSQRDRETEAYQRLVDACDDAEVDAATRELQSNFQLRSYAHDPSTAKIDRGPSGRSRLSALVRFGSAVPATGVSSRKPIGSLREMRARQAELDANRPPKPDRRFEYVIKLSMTAPVQELHRPSGTFGTHTTLDIAIRAAGALKIPKVKAVPRTLQEMVAQAPQRAKNAAWTSSYVGRQHYAFERNVHLVSCWEASMAGRQAQSAQLGGIFINHTTPANHLQVQTERIQWVDEFYDGVESATPAPAAPATKAKGGRHGTEDSRRSIPGPQSNNTSKKIDVGNARMLFDMPAPAPSKQRRPKHPWTRVAPKVTGVSTPSKPAKTTSKANVSPRDIERLVIAVAVIRVLAGGLDQGSRAINWHAVRQGLHFKYDIDTLKARWNAVKSRENLRLESVQTQFRDWWLDALVRDEVVDIESGNLEKIDWSFVVNWAESRFDQASKVVHVQLPEDRTDFDQKFEAEQSAENSLLAKDDFYSRNATIIKRTELATRYARVTMTPRQQVARRAGSGQADPLMLAKSMVRANAATPIERFDQGAAYAKLNMIGERNCSSAISELASQKIIRHLNKGRTRPGRNYELHDTVQAALRRYWEHDTFDEAARFKTQLDDILRREGAAGVYFHGPNGHFLAVLNMVQSGRAQADLRLPPVDNSLEAKGEHLSKWGFTEGNYKTVHMDRERLVFKVNFQPNDTYVYGNPLRQVEIPLRVHVAGEGWARLPYWTDIHGGFIERNWKSALVAVLYMLAMRNGASVATMHQAYRQKLWMWEIEMILTWAEASGIAKRIGRDLQGWTTQEWWWLALAPHTTTQDMKHEDETTMDMRDKARRDDETLFVEHC